MSIWNDIEKPPELADRLDIFTSLPVTVHYLNNPMFGNFISYYLFNIDLNTIQMKLRCSDFKMSK
jgi:hypothetical protein